MLHELTFDDGPYCPICAQPVSAVIIGNPAEGGWRCEIHGWVNDEDLIGLLEAFKDIFPPVSLIYC